MSDDWLHLLRGVVDRVFELARVDEVLAHRLAELVARLPPDSRTVDAPPLAPTATTGGLSQPHDAQRWDVGTDHGLSDFEIASWAEPTVTNDRRPESGSPASDHRQLQLPDVVTHAVAPQTGETREARDQAPEPTPSDEVIESNTAQQETAAKTNPATDEFRADETGEGDDDAGDDGTRESATVLITKLTFAATPSGTTNVRILSPQSERVDEVTELGYVVVRSQLKAEALRGLVDPEGALRESNEASTVAWRAGLETTARRLSNCRLWMLSNGFATKQPRERLEEAADWFEVLAEVVTVVLALLKANARPARMKKVVELLAEAQSGLRAAVESLTATADADQLAAFFWLRDYTSTARVKVDRYMKRSEAPAPGSARSCLLRLDSIAGSDVATSTRQKQCLKLLNKLAHERDHLLREPDLAAHLWKEPLLPTLLRILELGVPPSDLSLREILWGIEDTIPPDLEIPLPAQRVFAEIKLHAERVERSSAETTTGADEEPSAAVLRCRELLEGKTVVMIGGDVRTAARRKIESAFGLGALDWVETSEKHQSVSDFETHIARPEVAVVLLGIRWSRHAYGGVTLLCAKHAKPMVWVPGGYNVNQLAHQILSQSSERLRLARA
jgi:hypothetical protein